MPSEVHLYTFGQDPFVLEAGDTAFFIHQGAPEVEVTAPKPVSGADVDPGKLFVSSTASKGAFRLGRLTGPYGRYIVAPESAENLGRLWDEQDPGSDFGVVLTARSESRGSAGDQLRTVLDSLAQGPTNDVSVHVVTYDSLTGDADG